MKLTHGKVLDAPVDLVWRHFTDLKMVGRCFPGAAVTEVHGNDFVGQVRSRLGPFTLDFHGTGALTLADAERRHARLEAIGTEQHGLGKVDIDITLDLAAVAVGNDAAQGAANARTQADLTTILVFRRAPMDFSAGLAQKASDPLVSRFLVCMATPDGQAHQHGDDAPLDLVSTMTEMLGAITGLGRRRA
ncbi:MAG: SRPBCC domain-containing protein [Terracoccus sp.]